MIAVKDISQIHRYIEVPLYIKTSSGKYVLYKSRNETIGEHTRFDENFPAMLFIRDEDEDVAIREVNKSIHKELTEALKIGDLETGKSLLTEAVENMFRYPRSKALVGVTHSLTESIGQLDQSALKQFLKISVKDYTTSAHSVCMSALAVNFAKYKNWPGEQTQTFGLCAMLHDIGKTEIPDKILRKAGPLTDDEFRIMRNHPQAGADILKNHVFQSVEVKNEVIVAVLNHHLRLDGSGYPLNKRMKLSYPVQALGILDAFEALTSDERPYRKPLPSPEALEILKGDVVNGKYDVNVFADIVGSLKG